jgi:hypothetical protein
MKTVAIVLGSVRPGRAAVRVAKFITHQVNTIMNKEGYESIWVDPFELNLPLLQTKFEYMEPTHGTFYNKINNLNCIVN